VAVEAAGRELVSIVVPSVPDGSSPTLSWP
jgi:hypothetical protein